MSARPEQGRADKPKPLLTDSEPARSCIASVTLEPMLARLSMISLALNSPLVRHAAALALVGWYLMIPPLAQHTLKSQTDLPISQWEQRQAFDSAQECETSKAALIRTYEDNATKNERTNDDRMKNLDERLIEHAVDGLCIATDDPRLKGK